MVEVLTSKDVLSTVFCQCKQQEIYPEPFRLQEDVTFLVSFDTYVAYIKTLSEDSPIQLTYPISYIQNLTESGNERAYDVFLEDMAFAICKEIFYSTEWNKPASLILPTSDSVRAYSLKMFAEMYSSSLVCESELLNRLSSFGYPIKSKLTDRNNTLLHTAVLLYHLGKLGRKRKGVISIIP